MKGYKDTLSLATMHFWSGKSRFPLSSLVTDTQESFNKIQPDQPITTVDIVANCDLMEGGQDLCDSGNWLCHRILLNYYRKSPNTVTSTDL